MCNSCTALLTFHFVSSHALLVLSRSWTANIINVGTLIYQAVDVSANRSVSDFNTFSEIIWICMVRFMWVFVWGCVGVDIQHHQCS